MTGSEQNPRTSGGRGGSLITVYTGAKFAFLLVVLLVAATGSLPGASAEEVREDASAPIETVDTYGFKANTTMEISVGNETPISHSLTVDSEGIVDEKEGTLEAHSTVKTLGTEVNQDVYVVNGTMYTRTNGVGLPGEPDEWYKIEESPMVSSALDSFSHAERYEAILNISEVNHKEDAEIGGEPVNVLSHHPDPQEYGELVLDRIESMSTARRRGAVTTAKRDVFDDVRVENASVKYWVSKETGYVLRTRSDVNMTTSMSLPHSGEREVRMDIQTDVRMFDHGDDVEVELPEGAGNAEDYEELLRDEAAGPAESVEGSEGEGVSTDLTEAPDAENVDRTTDSIVERYEFEVKQTEAFGEIHRVTVYIEDSFEAETLTVEGLESDTMVRTDSPDSARHLSVAGVKEGEEIAVTATKENGTVVRQTFVYES